MNCECNVFVFPPPMSIAPGLIRLPRQIGTFAEFRRALSHAASLRSTALLEDHPLWSMRYLTERDRGGLRKSLEAIGQWRGRHPEDFGILLLDMWAYVCDLTSFYDDVYAHDTYVRTARRRDSLRRLVDPLGYVARPAIAALADLAALADGRRVVTLPPGTAFRSGAFPGSAPQVFELTAEAHIHSFFNAWQILALRRDTFGPTATAKLTFLCEVGSVTVKAADVVLVKVGSARYARRVVTVAPFVGVDHQTYSAITLSATVPVPGGTPTSAVSLWKPTLKSGLWSRTGDTFGTTTTGTPPFLSAVNTWFNLSAPTATFKTADEVIVQTQANLVPSVVSKVENADINIQPASTSKITDGSSAVIAVVPVPAVVAQTTKITVTPPIFPAWMFWLLDVSTEITVHHGLVPAGRITIEALPDVANTDPLAVAPPVDLPRDTTPPGVFQLDDANGDGVTRPGILNFATGEFSVQGDPWADLATPVRLSGNIIAVSRGETVSGEYLGAGDASVANQSFTLKKSPLTYLPTPSSATPSGLTSTLQVFVANLQWTEVPSFYGQAPEEPVFIVRQNDDDESVVTFGDGQLARRLETGAPVVAYYRFGGGGTMPPSGSITQVAKPVPGLKGVRGPVAAYGGADSEPASSLRKYAPRSALLLGRAVSLPDVEAAAASFSGVRAVSAEWRWRTTRQVPVVHVWYLADGDLTELLLNRLHSLTQPDVPIQVERATPLTTALGLQLACDPKRFEGDVLVAVRGALFAPESGLLTPEQLGIGKTLFRSHLFDAVLEVPGATAVTGLTLSGASLSAFGVTAPAGQYFDFAGGLMLNGRLA